MSIIISEPLQCGMALPSATCSTRCAPQARYAVLALRVTIRSAEVERESLMTHSVPRFALLGVRHFFANPLARSPRSLSGKRQGALRLPDTSPACVSLARVPFVFGCWDAPMLPILGASALPPQGDPSGALRAALTRQSGCSFLAARWGCWGSALLD